MKRAKVFVADRSPAFLLGATATLGQLPQVEVVGHSTSGAEALKLVEALTPDVFIFDADMLGLAEWEALWRLRERPVPPRVVITSHDLNEQSRACASAVGADVCLTKEEFGRRLCRAVGGLSAPAVLAMPFDPISARERRQIQLLANCGGGS